MNESASVPIVGSQVGRYQLLREIAKGPYGALYELRAAEGASQLSGLGRLLCLPGGIEAGVEQAISEAAWESMELRHDMALCVADVVFGKGWITLVHDHSEGSLLRSLQRRSQERQSAFPLAVSLRVALDVLAGLELSHRACEAAGVAWCPGGTSATSLYLCGDGRTRNLDGQVVTVLTRLARTCTRMDVCGFPPPELLDPEQVPDERADVFAVGALLWELLTGRELTLEPAVAEGQRPRSKVANINLSVPKGTSIPGALAQLVHAALELDPAKRPATREELKAALASMGEVASYEKVIDFTDALLNRESTLFRLTLDAGPKLSDELEHNRPKPNHLEWAAELAKHAHAAEAQHRADRTSTAGHERKAKTALTAPKPIASLAPRGSEAVVGKKPLGQNPRLGQRTLIGIAAPATSGASRPLPEKADARNARASRPDNTEPAAPRAEAEKPQLERTLAPTLMEKPESSHQADPLQAVAKTRVASAPEGGASTSPREAVIAQHASPSLATQPANLSVREAVIAQHASPSLATQPANLSVAVASSSSGESKASQPSTGSLAQALCERALSEQAPIVAASAAMSPPAAAALDPLSKALVSVTAPGVVVKAEAIQVPVNSKRVIQLNLSTVVLGALATCVLAVLTTLAVVKGMSASLTPKEASLANGSAATATASPNLAQGVGALATAARQDPLPAAATDSPRAPTTADASGATAQAAPSAIAAPDLANVPPLAAEPAQPAAPTPAAATPTAPTPAAGLPAARTAPAPATPKPTIRKRKQYVPREL